MAGQRLLAHARRHVPQTHAVVPGGGEGVLTIVGQTHVLNDVRVTLEGLDGRTARHNERGVIDGITRVQLPHEASVIARRRDERIHIDGGSGERSDPSIVALEASTKSYLSRHFLQNAGERIAWRKRVRLKGRV